MEHALQTRTLSSFPLSIGTGLMLESIFKPTIDRYDNERKIPQGIGIDTFNTHIYNILTIIRNILSAAKIKNILNVDNSQLLVDTVIDETIQLMDLYSGTKCRPVIYIPKYDDVWKTLNLHKKNTNDNTQPGIKWYSEYSLYKKYFKAIADGSYIDRIENVYKFNNLKGKTLITTSYAVDLLNHTPSQPLFLLESHTGLLKNPLQWQNKYHDVGNRDLSMLPFNQVLVWLLGDSQNMIVPAKLSVRTKILDISLSKKWTPNTSVSKVMSDLNTDNDIKEMLNNYKPIY